MRTHRIVSWLAAPALCLSSHAQYWNTTGNNITGSEWFGADGSSSIPLQIRHDNNYSIQWFTNALMRMQMEATQSVAIGSFGPMPTDGFVTISPTDYFNTSCGDKTPFSRLHLAEGSGDACQSLGYRPWMRNGVSVTGNADQGYLGQKYTFDDPEDYESGELEDYTDIVIQWSDNPGKALKDRMRFIFTSEYDESATGAGSLEGLEGMRLFPVNGDNVNVGIGDWYAANVGDPSIIEPEERLDIVDGKVRIRQLPNDSPEEDEKVMVVDDDGVVHWRPFGDFDECDWIVQNEGVSGGGTGHDLSTALGTSDLCPDYTDLVGIGINPTAAKLQVEANSVDHGVPTTGVYVHLQIDDDEGGKGIHAKLEPDDGTADNQVGVYGEVYNSTTRQSGVYGVALTNADISVYDRNVGVDAYSNITDGTVDLGAGMYSVANAGSGSAVNKNAGLFTLVYGTGSSTSYGVKADVIGGATNYGAYLDAWNTATTNYGLWARATGATTNWAGWFSGDLWITGYGWVQSGTAIISDENLKTNIEDVTDGLDRILQLNPKTYDFNVAAYPHMDLDEGHQIGLLAQEVEEVVPEAVKSTTYPEQFDSEGNQISEAMPIKGIVYEKIVPLLISAIKEQEATIAQQSARLDEMEETLSNCCSNMGGGGDRSEIQIGSDLVTGNERALTIQPNPFNERTTLYYTLERSGRMQLMANSADGKQLRVLQEANLEAGHYQHEWQTSELKPGVYYVTLLLDGEPIVKKAVKVQR